MKLQILVVVCLCMLTAAAMSSDDDLAIAVGDAQKANQKALTQYSWKVQTTLSMDGEQKATALTQMNFDSDGKLQATHLGGESSVEKKRGVRGRRQEKKIGEFEEYLEGVLDQSFKYIFLSKGTLVDIFDRAKITQGDDAIQVEAGDLFVKGDQLSMTVDPKTNLATKLSFKTTLDQDTIQGSVTLGMMDDGTGKPVKTEIEVPTRSIKIASETSDWVKQQ